MRNSSFITLGIAIFGFLIFVFPPQGALAKTDLSISSADISFSKSEPIEGETVRIFARVFNIADEDAYGFVVFLKNDKTMADPQPISVRANTYDDVFIDWVAEEGKHNIGAKIVEVEPKDTNLGNNIAVQKNFFVDIDTDKDGIGNSRDLDDDNDGLSDEIESLQGTNPLIADTDKDGVRDGDDAFPLNAKETVDTDGDGIGNNADEDDDNDGLTDEKELWIYESNPLKPDTDGDGLTDREEVEMGTDLLKADTDGDGVVDINDKFPLDASRAQASILDIVWDFVKEKGLFSGKIFAGAIFLFLIFLMFFVFRRKTRYR